MHQEIQQINAEKHILQQITQVAQLSQRDRAAGCVSYGQKWKTGTGVQHYRSIFNRDVFGQQRNQIRWKMQNKGYYAVQGHSRSSRSVPIESQYASSC